MNKQFYQKGISLFEFLIYLMLLLFFSTICFRWMVQISTQSYHMLDRANEQATIYMAYDLLEKDIRGAPRDLELWHKKESNHILWGSDNAVEWYFNNARLYRKKGAYDSKGKRWIKATTNVVLQPVKEGEFRISTKRGIYGLELATVACSIVMNNHKQHYTSDAMAAEQRILWHKEDQL